MIPVEPVVVGLDLSIKATGIAHAIGDTEVFKPESDGLTNYGMDRITEVRNHVMQVLDLTAHVELVMIESLAFAAHDTNRQLAMLAGVVRQALFDARYPFLLVAPGQLKKYATGSGKASKEAVVDAAQRRLRYEGYNNNEADALWLRAMGWELVGMPVTKLPELHRSALAELFKAVPALREAKR